MLSFEDLRGQSAHLAQLRSDFAQGTNVHAYLLSGPAGTGKKSAARLCAQTAMCRGENKPCGVCGPCRRVLAGTHPDIHEIAPENGKKTIGVEAIRQVIEEVGVSAFEGGVKALICPQAEKMTPQAQNCLLKTLEEPPEKTVFFLITDQPGALLPTIVSRCRKVSFHPLDMESAKKRLMAHGLTQAQAAVRAHMSEGCVGQALLIDEASLALRAQVTRDVFGIKHAADIPGVLAAYKDDKEKQKSVLDVLEAAVRDIMLAQSGKAPLTPGLYDGKAEDYARSVPLAGAIALSRAILQAKKMCGSNVAFASAFETILLKVSEEYARWPW